MRVRFVCLWFVVGALFSFSSVARGEPYARRLDASNLQGLRVGGMDAIAGVDDWALGDGVLCAVISDTAHESDFSTRGGSLVDLGRCGRGDDQFLIFDQLRNLSPSRSLPVAIVTAEQGGGWAQVRAAGEEDGIAAETIYRLEAAAPGRLRISTRVTRRADGQSLFGVGGAFANAYTLRPFVTSIASPGRSRGFVGPAFIGKGAGAVADAAVAADAVVLVGDSTISPGVSYGARIVRAEHESSEGARQSLPLFIVADDLATILAIFSQPFWVGGESALGWTQLLQTRWMDVDVQESIAYELELVVGERADVASALDQLLAHASILSGQVDDPSARIRVDTLDGAPVTQMSPDADGRFRARLLPGEYDLSIDAPGGRTQSRRVTMLTTDTDLGALPVAAAARVELPRGRAMRLVFVGTDGTPDPVFGDDLLGFAVLGKEIERTASTRDIVLSGTAADPTSVPIPPGRYHVYATRGLEFGVTEANLEVKAATTVSLEIEPPLRAFETPGWIAADFHVHGARSLDSALGDRERLTAFVAEGGEVLVATDHEAVTDYAPQVRAMGLQGQIATVIGLEVTTEAKTAAIPHTIGHANAFPYRADPLAYRDGTPPNEGRRWRDILPALRSLPGERVVQLNHARYPGATYNPRGFFTHLGWVGEPYDPSKTLSEWPNRILVDPDPVSGARDIDFDAMEILNGKRSESYVDLLADWVSFLRQGIVMTGTANSDSHNLQQITGVPRNYVAVPDDRVEAFDEAAFVQAVRRQRVTGTTGPFVEANLSGAGLGERFRGADGVLNVRVQAPPWVPIEELRVLVDGKPAVTYPVDRPGEWSIPLHFAADTFVIVEVLGSASPTYTAVLPGFKPLAFTNPIFIDANGDGEWCP